MKERIVEILVYLMSEIETNKRLSEIDLGGLKEKGYTQSEISAAFSWLYDNLPVHEGRVTLQGDASRDSRRQLHDAEKLIMTTAAQGYLMQIYELGLIDNRDMEGVLDRAMTAGFEKLTTGEIQEIVAAVLFTKTNRWHERRFTMNNNDTIH